MRPRTLLLVPLFGILSTALASSGDRNPTFQHCLRGCSLTYCDPSQPAIPLYLRAFGWTCEDNCKYDCAHSFTDNIRPGGRWHQFYGKWPFRRLGPIQEPFSVLMSLANLYVHLRGIAEVGRRVREENRLRGALAALGWVQVNTWVWSAVFHTRDTPITERLDYFSATLTIAATVLYTVLRTLGLSTPITTSRLVLPISICLALIVISHFTYLLSFPLGSFPYGYHTAFAIFLSLPHQILWILWSVSFYAPLPSIQIGSTRIGFPRPYPPQDPYHTRPRPREASTPVVLVLLTILAMSFELLDFAPIFRTIDAHSIWHASTVFLGIAWWTFLINDAIELEGIMLEARGGTNSGGIESATTATTSSRGLGIGMGMASGASSPQMPSSPNMVRLASGVVGGGPVRPRSPGLGRSPKGLRED
ncbi:Per1-like-domain-containing protein [Naematelia encephala]|uniref:Post-GPI attachment to proteins factor 3 n=1 Tax=Naematelia encephala TaxID=71784 RepID=A0A1Y2AMZ4_9TREE|nr:Per1-like-domain-containing protein [Naematelia encephala]